MLEGDGGSGRDSHLCEAEEESNAAEDLQSFCCVVEHHVSAGVTEMALCALLEENNTTSPVSLVRLQGLNSERHLLVERVTGDSRGVLSPPGSSVGPGQTGTGWRWR